MRLDHLNSMIFKVSFVPSIPPPICPASARQRYHCVRKYIRRYLEKDQSFLHTHPQYHYRSFKNAFDF